MDQSTATGPDSSGSRRALSSNYARLAETQPFPLSSSLPPFGKRRVSTTRSVVGLNSFLGVKHFAAESTFENRGNECRVANREQRHISRFICASASLTWSDTTHGA